MAVWGAFTNSCEKKRSEKQKEKEIQKGKLIAWGSLTNSLETREAKGKGEKEWYTHLNAEFPIAKRDKKAILSDQC